MKTLLDTVKRVLTVTSFINIPLSQLRNIYNVVWSDSRIRAHADSLECYFNCFKSLNFLNLYIPHCFFCFCFSLLSNYYNHSKRKDDTDLTILAEGELIAAKFKENWYRARVVNAAEDLVQVRISTFELKSRVEWI